MGIDPGITDPIGWYFIDGALSESGLIATPSKYKAQHWYEEINVLLTLWKPDVLLVCKPAGRFGGVLFAQGKQCGVIQCLCEKKGIKYIEKHDSRYRLAIKPFPTKKMVQEISGLPNHISDAWMAVQWYLKENEQKD